MKSDTTIYSVDFSNPEEVTGFVSSLHLKQTFKQSLERQWYINIAWYMGLQNLIWNDGSGSLYEPEAPSYRVRMVVNMLQSTVRKLSSKIYRVRPEWDVIPATTDSHDIGRAAISKNILSFEWMKQDMPTKSLETLHWLMTTGNAVNKAYWDPELGDPVPVLLEDGTIDREELQIGDTAVEVISPFNFNFDPNGPLRDSAWCLESKYMSRSEVEDKYEVKEHSSNDKASTKFGEYLKRLTVNRSGFGTVERENVSIVHELWVKPGAIRSHPKGGYYVIVGDKIINGKGKGVDFPYIHGQLPYVHYVEVVTPGRSWGESTLTQLIPLQASYNKTRSQLQEAKNLMSKPKWVVPKGSGLPHTSITSEPGEILEPNPGFRIEQIAPVPMPSYVANLLQQDKSDMEDIASIHEVSKADSPGQLRGSQGVMALIEQDETVIGLTIQGIEKQQERLGRQLLSLNAQFVTEERLARIVGESNEVMIFTFRGRDIIGQSDLPGADYFDVRIETAVGLPNSKQAQQALLTNLTDKGYLNPQDPKDKKLVFRLLSIGNTMEHLDKSRPQRGKQMQEIEQMVNGEQSVPSYWEDHDVHLEVLNDFRNSSRYLNLEEQQRAILEQHAQGHKQLLAFNSVEPQMLVQQMVQQMMPQQPQQQAQPAGAA